MAWTLKVNVLESCSCAAVCPCVLGPAKPDQEWCSGVFGLNVTEGDSDGVDLSGAKLVLLDKQAPVPGMTLPRAVPEWFR